MKDPERSVSRWSARRVLNPKAMAPGTPEHESLWANLQCVGTQELIAAARQPEAVMQLIRELIANRGVDQNGEWIGFPEAQKIWRGK